jgi:hypothetical protein
MHGYRVLGQWSLALVVKQIKYTWRHIFQSQKKTTKNQTEINKYIS